MAKIQVAKIIRVWVAFFVSSVLATTDREKCTRLWTSVRLNEIHCSLTVAEVTEEWRFFQIYFFVFPLSWNPYIFLYLLVPLVLVNLRQKCLTQIHLNRINPVFFTEYCSASVGISKELKTGSLRRACYIRGVESSTISSINFSILLICSFRSITGNILQL